MIIKVSGFTLLEAMVSLLLSSLLVTFTFSIYKNFNKYYFIYTNQTERLNEILHFKRTFNQDWNKALIITGEENQLLLSNQKQKVSYEFLDSTIVRKGTIKTVFNLVPKEKELETNYDTKKVTKINLEVENNGQSFLFSSIKNYGVKDLVINATKN